MDFFKACTTNIHVVESASQMSCRSYARATGNFSSNLEAWKLSRKALLTLRTRNFLCTVDTHRLWVFGAELTAADDLLDSPEYAYAIETSTTLKAAASDRFSSGKSIIEAYLAAVEAAIAFKLAERSGVLHLGAWTWICGQAVDDSDPFRDAVLIRLRASFSAAGSLILALRTTVTTADLCSPVQFGRSGAAILAPHGLLAQTLPHDSALPVDDETWKMFVRYHLESEGLLIIDSMNWQLVQLEGVTDNLCVSWPAHLCLARETSNSEDFPTRSDQEVWRRWFGTDGDDSFRNPLAMAEEWSQNAVETGTAPQGSPHGDKVISGQNETSRDPMELAGTDSNMVSSPLTQRHNEQQMAVAGIYPTPPDGITQGSNNTQTTSDIVPSAMQLDQNDTNMDLSLGDDELHLRGRDSIGSAFQQDFTLQTDALFEDRGGEMELGDDAVDDADFSFFDEPDNEPPVGDTDDISVLQKSDVETETAHPKTELPTDNDSDQVTNVSDVQTFTQDHKAVDVPTHADASTFDNQITDKQSSLRIEADLTIDAVSPRLEKPLSPFGIRERLLPPPVPASVVQNDLVQPLDQQRRSSSFAPVRFKDGFSLNARYASSDAYLKSSPSKSKLLSAPNISLPRRRKHRQAVHTTSSSQGAQDDSDSDEDSYDSSSPSEKEISMPPKLPWETKKRKRYPDPDPGTPNSIVFERAWTDAFPENKESTPAAEGQMYNLLRTYCSQPLQASGSPQKHFESLRSDILSHLSSLQPAQKTVFDRLPRLEDIYDLSKQDFIYIAQIISEQTVSAMAIQSVDTDFQAAGEVHSNEAAMLSAGVLLVKIFELLFPDVKKSELSQIALTREPLSRPTASSKPQPGHPRPLQRSDSVIAGPDFFTVAQPYVRVQRGTDNWEMLPTCLSFWEPLGLGPAGGPKNVRAFCVYPANEDLQHLVEQFMVDLGAAYESCKLGSHIHQRRPANETNSPLYEDGMAPVELGDDASIEAALRSYAATCTKLGKTLAHIEEHESNRNTVVYLLNPFYGPRGKQLMCACFWMLFKAYRDNVTKVKRSQGCDVVLQLLPIDILASFDTPMMHQAKDMAVLAREVYDRCPPPPTKLQETSTSLPILVAPSVELASPVPKRIGFQLSAEQPIDLLHEGSILHLAYAKSRDGQWLIAVWIDNFGQHFASTAYCLLGRSFAEIAASVWERTRDIIAARRVMWRIFIVSNEDVDKSTSRCWCTLSAKTRQQQPLCVTLLKAQMKPVVQLTPPTPTIDHVNQHTSQESNVLTPASTPQGATFTSSPDMGGLANAPPTPAPSETAASMAENDPDAHLTDLADDAWAMLLSPQLSTAAPKENLANGILFKRGKLDASYGSLPSLGVKLIWTIQVKLNGNVDEGSMRQAELTLREVLRIYRNLVLLTKARGLDYGVTAMAPLHIASAMRGAEQLDGMLSEPLA